MREWLEQQNVRIAITFLRPYAPELNPVLAIRAYLKKHEIANLCPTHLAEFSDFARRLPKSTHRRPKLARSGSKRNSPSNTSRISRIVNKSINAVQRDEFARPRMWTNGRTGQANRRNGAPLPYSANCASQ